MSAVDLSSINRAAMSAKEGYAWIHGLALLYCVVVGLFSVAAWLNEGEPFRAAVCAGAQVLSIIMALVARRGFTGQMTVSGIACVGIAFGFALWAAEGLAHAWSANGAQIEEWQVWFLTGSEPAIFLLIEHIKEGRDALRKAQEKADREEAEALAIARAKDEASAASRAKSAARPGDNRSAGEKSTVTRLKLVETVRRPDDQPGEAVDQPADGRSSTDQPVDALPQPVVPEHNHATFADPDAHARHLIKVENVRHRNELARRVRGLSAYRASQLLDEHAPGWRAKRTTAA